MAPNTVYDVSFWLANANTVNVASVQPELAGIGLLGSPVSAVGTWGSNGWQQFTFSFDSGSNTSTDLILHNYQTSPDGNDFGVDDIAVATATAPEPSTLLLLASGLAIMGLGRRKRACSPVPTIV